MDKTKKIVLVSELGTIEMEVLNGMEIAKTMLVKTMLVHFNNRNNKNNRVMETAIYSEPFGWDSFGTDSFEGHLILVGFPSTVIEASEMAEFLMAQKVVLTAGGRTMTLPVVKVYLPEMLGSDLCPVEDVTYTSEEIREVYDKIRKGTKFEVRFNFSFRAEGETSSTPKWKVALADILTVVFKHGQRK